MKDFDEIYVKLQLNHSVELNNLRNKFKPKIIISKYHNLFAFIIFFLLEGLNYTYIYNDYKFIFYLLSIVIIIVFIFYLIKNSKNKKVKYPSCEQIKLFNDNNITNYINYFKNDLIKDLIINTNNNIIYYNSNGLNEDIYIKYLSKLDSKKYTKYISEDYIKINNIWIYNVNTYRNETDNIKNEYPIFNGLISISKTGNASNFIISQNNYKNKTKKIQKYNIYGNVELDENIINSFNHFIEYTGSTFDLVCENNCLFLRANLGCMFSPNIYKGHMPKKLLYEYYKNLYEFILLSEKITNYFK